MAKKSERTVYVCENCGEEYLQWQGRCNVCGQWNTLKEFHVPSAPTSRSTAVAGPVAIRPLQEVGSESITRISTGIQEADRVFGGGIVPGSIVLIGGDPGIGKSTLLLQLADRINQPVLYVTGEESPEQVKLRANRLGVSGASIQLLPVTDVGQVQAAIEQQKPALVIVDSIQTMYDPAFPSTPGSIVQVRETAMRMQQLAKGLAVPVILVGHITKEGTVAGPRTLEHLVDAVFYLEGEAQHDLRILRAVKNRFGDAAETGLFTMGEQGLQEVSNPSDFLLSERLEAPGSVLAVIMEGSRPILIEVQALVTATVFGYPRRTVSGFDQNRLNLLLAVLQRRAGVDLSNHDVFVNIVGGLKVRDTGIDAAVCAALASAKQGVPVAGRLAVIGEVGLAGELRRVSQQERREKEVTNLGYTVPQFDRQLNRLLQEILPNRKRS